MSTQITITLPDTVYGHAANLANMTGQSVADILATTIAVSLPTFSTAEEAACPMSELLDDEVVALTDSWMETTSAARLSQLLERQQAETITDDERKELDTLMQHYSTGLLRKAQAWNEAVKRGLRETMSDES